MPSPPPARPEVLAPAGDAESLAAALAAGADAVYFGLSEGFNARARAGNFALAELPATVARIHRAGAKAYLALNTLVFETELDDVAGVVRRAADAGVDALIVQDVGLAVLARALAPTLHVHASTQMTVSSAEGARFAQGLGVTRVVVPREASVEEIARLAAGTGLELEVFVHGALCVAWSGQCFTSSTWSARSANRGECAQSCRLPYELVLDGVARDLGDVRYLLSPKDLAGLGAVERLAALGVSGLKIEGRQKGATYVRTATEAYRRWVDAVARGPTPADLERAKADLSDAALAYSRGFSPGFLGGSDHQSLVEGRFPKHRGLLLGRVARLVGDAVFVEPGPLEPGPLEPGPLEPGPLEPGPLEPGPTVPRPGMGVVFDDGHPEREDEPGGPIFHADPWGAGWRLRFGQPGPDLRRVSVGQRVWVNGDPRLVRATQRAIEGGEPAGRVPLALALTGRAGSPLCVEGRAGAAEAVVRSTEPLAEATGAGLTEALAREKLGALGGTPFTLAALDLTGLAPGLHLPVSALKSLRRDLVAALLPALERGRAHALAPADPLPALRAAARTPPGAATLTAPRLVPLCREPGQLEAVIEAGLPEVELDWMEFVGLGAAVARARAAGLSVTLATVRVQKPGEEGYDRRLAALAPDGVLVRHWGALMAFAEGPRQAGDAPRPALHGDFSLNVTNALTAGELFRRGLSTLTLSHDLDAPEALALLSASDPARFTVVLHHRMPTFHTEHCVYAHLLSAGRDFRTCGRPCERHRLALRDPRGREHPVIVDVACRNTVFNDRAQSAAPLLSDLVERGVRRFRVELVRETQAETAAILSAYGDLLAGRTDAPGALGRAQATPRLGLVDRQAR